MSNSAEQLAALVSKRFERQVKECSVYVGEVTVVVQPQDLIDVCRALRDESDFQFEQLIDVCGVDYLGYGSTDWETSESASNAGFSRGVTDRSPEMPEEGPRFATVYHLLSVKNNQRLRVKCPLEGEPPRVSSVIDVWNSADWFEREAFDLFGILFDGHPDLRRILTDYGFVGHPFRKDFPLVGQVEMRYDPEKKRVVYEPVSIEPRTLVPRVIRSDERYSDEDAGSASAEEKQSDNA